jgi:2-aminobenzoate-CoA ligase
MHTAHIDTFAADHLPPAGQWPEFLLDAPGLQFPAQLNCATELLDSAIDRGWGDCVCIRAPGGLVWTYRDLQAQADRIAHVLVHDMGLVSGNRVLLRAPNNPMLAACWFAVVKAGAIAVATMPLLRAKELGAIIDKAQVSHALCDLSLAQELQQAAAAHPVLRQMRFFHGQGVLDGAASVGRPARLETDMARHTTSFANVPTAATDTCLLAFTSGTTGVPKATMHCHRDVMAVCHCWPTHVLRPRADDVFLGSPPLAFTFGLGGLLLFPMAVGASTVLLEKASPPQLAEAIPAYGVTTLFTAPTSYRLLSAHGPALRQSALRQCVSAGEALPAATRAQWNAATGIELIDGIGATELLHIFISADEAHARPGATGTVVPGYLAQVQDDQGREVPPGTVGRLAVKGPTGCRYLGDERQTTYVKNGWNLTGDAYLMDADGYFFYQARTDDMIVSAGYNVASPEVEEALMLHPAVAECAVIGVPDAERGQVITAFVVPQAGVEADEALVKTLQDFVKGAIAPYKYPRVIRFADTLPRTQTGKLQRFRLHDLI